MYWSPGLAVAIASTIAPPLTFSSAWHGMHESVVSCVSFVNERASECVFCFHSAHSFVFIHFMHFSFLFQLLSSGRRHHCHTPHTTPPLMLTISYTMAPKAKCVCARFINIHLYLPFFGSFVVNGSLETAHTHPTTQQRREKKRENKITTTSIELKSTKERKTVQNAAKKKPNKKLRANEWMSEEWEWKGTKKVNKRKRVTMNDQTAHSPVNRRNELEEKGCESVSAPFVLN